MINEDYLPCREYENQSAHATVDNFTVFYHVPTQRYFFALLDGNKEVLLKSEGYPQQAARENGIESVKKNRGNSDFYSVKSEEGKYYLSLRAANYREIARSCSFDSADAASAILPLALGAASTAATDTSSMTGAHSIAATAIAATTVSAQGADIPAEVEDDYLPCRDYVSHIDLSHHGYNKFSSEVTGKYYFAVVDGHDHVSLRSEGHPTEAERDADMDDVQHNILIKERYEIKKVGFHHYFIVLRNKNGKEIGRSCAYDGLEAIYDAAPFLAPTLEEVKPSTTEGVALAAAAAAAAIPALEFAEKVVETPVPPAYSAAAPLTADVDAGGFKWWWILLPLLAVLAWWLFTNRGCNKAEVVMPAVTTLAVEPPKPVETPKAAMPVPVAVESCNFNWIFFDFNKSDLRTASKTELDDMTAILKKNPDYVALLRANTDFKGSDAYNEALSSRRANNAKQYLIAKGIVAARIKTAKNGEKDPIAKNEVGGADTEQGRQFNRRVELFVQDKTGKNICTSVAPDVPAELKEN